MHVLGPAQATYFLPWHAVSATKTPSPASRLGISCWRATGYQSSSSQPLLHAGVRFAAAIYVARRFAAKRVRRRAGGSDSGISSPNGAPNGSPSILVVGGTGRVGGSTARWLQQLATEEGLPAFRIAVAGRSRDRYSEFAARWASSTASISAPDEDALRNCVPEFVALDLGSSESIQTVLGRGWDLIVHAAGPFQGIERPVLLEAAVKAGVPYVDVCDDTDLCGTAKALAADAKISRSPAVVSTGIWPGVSALMVAEAVERLGGPAVVDDVDLSFFTAGTGGAGATIVSATFLLLAEPPLIYRSGDACRDEPWGSRRLADFGQPIGERYVHLLDEPEVYTCNYALGIPNMRSSFGTDPDIWNWLFAAVRLLPTEVLRNRELMQAVSVFSMPIINAVDRLVGSANAMRVDAIAKDGQKLTLRITHEDLEDCVGLATAAFGLEVLQDRIPAGVWFPVELSEASRKSILSRVQRNTLLWEM